MGHFCVKATQAENTEHIGLDGNVTGFYCSAINTICSVAGQCV